MKLTKEQKNVIAEVLKFHKNEITVGGHAGCGKTTIIQHLITLLPGFAVCAYTGKATNVLRTKGVEKASTIHSLIYKPYVDVNKKVYFSLASNIEYEGIVVDEASMVSSTIYKDLMSFKKPVIFVGDHGQLEPIGDSFNLMQNPDYKLETIHRNAGEIAHFAEYIRNGYRPASWEVRHGSSDKIQFLNKQNYVNVFEDVDQIICAFNKTRAEVNKKVRDAQNRGAKPEIGDRVICLRNDAKLGLFNGMQGEIVDLNKFMMTFQSEDNTFDNSIEIAYEPSVFGQVKYEFDRDRDSPHPFDYAYAVTAHKFQGSEQNKILVLEQKCDLWDSKRWSYTAASRAREKIYWCQLS